MSQPLSLFCRRNRNASRLLRFLESLWQKPRNCWKPQEALLLSVCYSRMRSKGSRFTLGVWGLRECSLDVAQPFATVRNGSQPGRMAMPMVSSAKGVIFGGLKPFTLHLPHFTFYTLHSTLYTLHFTLHTLHSTLYLHSTLHTPHFTLHTAHSTLYTPHSTLHTLSTLHTPHSTLCAPPSFAFHSLQCTGTVTWKNVQDCSNTLFHKSVLCDCIRLLL